MDSHYDGQPGSQQQPNPYQQQPPYYQPPKTNGKAITALVLGVSSIVIPYIGFFIGIVGIIFGNLSLKEIKRTGEQGRGLGIAGLVCSIIGTILWVLIVGVVVAIFIFAASSGDSFNYDNNYSLG
ncbi:DUF4190 domain-containing protein [Paenibacillus sp. sgz302251]|uniref:DUF4190 domain-containing protein n=1 Tax=Paenibacillus sp. sgz302251 TaxID=3414493 RepID=UPI003C7CBAEB